MFNTTVWSKCLAPVAAIFGLIVFHDVCYAINPHVPWDSDWDNLDAVSKTAVERMFGFRMKANRNIFLVRNGHYTDDQFGLSGLGKDQAKLVARRLKSFRFPYTSIVYSCVLKRGKETSEIIGRCLPGVQICPCDMIHTGIPIKPEPVTVLDPVLSSEDVLMDGERMEAAFRKYFYRPSQNQSMDSYEIIVCPSNVIRYFVCRAMQFPPEAWRRFSLHNCSITWLSIGDDGAVTLLGFGEFGHIPNEKLTP